MACRHEERTLDGRCAYCSRTDDGENDAHWSVGADAYSVASWQDEVSGAVDEASGTVYSDADGGL